MASSILLTFTHNSPRKSLLTTALPKWRAHFTSFALSQVSDLWDILTFVVPSMTTITLDIDVSHHTLVASRINDANLDHASSRPPSGGRPLRARSFHCALKRKPPRLMRTPSGRPLAGRLRTTITSLSFSPSFPPPRGPPPSKYPFQSPCRTNS